MPHQQSFPKLNPVIIKSDDKTHRSPPWLFCFLPVHAQSDIVTPGVLPIAFGHPTHRLSPTLACSAQTPRNFAEKTMLT